MLGLNSSLAAMERGELNIDRVISVMFYNFQVNLIFILADCSVMVRVAWLRLIENLLRLGEITTAL